MRRTASELKPPMESTGQRSGRFRRERQMVRILSLLRTLSQGRMPTVHELASEFKTRRETIYRDLRALQDAGYPIAGDEQGRLSRPRLLPSHVPELRFSAAEIEALLLAVAQAQPALPSAEVLSAVTLKLQELAEFQRTSCAVGIDRYFECRTFGAKDYHAYEATIAVVVEAILRKRSCRVQYKRPASVEPKTYDFEPYRLLYIEGGLYVVGNVPKHNNTVTLSVDRISRITMLTSVFHVDPKFDPQKCRDEAFGVSWQDPKEIVLHFSADQATYVRERLWHHSQTLTDLPNGRIRMRFRAGGPFEIRRWILGWGDAVEVIAPTELRDELKETLLLAARSYRG